ncbi:MAG: hypothetical protein IKE70_02185 [Bacilli bacterium]|nr:hypothetical protein [Bacilli bacterium]
MKKYYIFFFIVLLFYFIYPRSDYVELNHLSIIREIKFKCEKNYNITLKEIIPQKKDNGIHYQYKDYSFSGESFDSLKREISNSNKNFYFKHVHLLKTNCSEYQELFSLFSISSNKVKVKKLS